MYTALITTRLSSKGQIILPKSVRDSHCWQPGLEFAIEDCDDAIVLKPVKPFQATQLQDVIGCTGYSGPKRTLEEMKKAIAKGARERK